MLLLRQHATGSSSIEGEVCGDTGGSTCNEGESIDGSINVVDPTGVKSIQTFGLSPLSGPRLGGTVLHIFAPSFGGGAAYRCRFDDGDVTDGDTVATYDAVNEILTCPSRPLTIGAADVSISLNAQDFSTYPVKVRSWHRCKQASPHTFTDRERASTSVVLDSSPSLIMRS